MLPVKPALRGGLFLSAVASLAAVVVLMLAIWLLFAPALPGIVQFDDLANLSKLNTITGFDEAWDWISQGRAGPLGRPIALATFALQYYQWPQPYSLLLWNIALHVINALLVLWLSLLVAQRLGPTDNKQLAIGFLVALCWGILPLLNTSTLFIIQRMTVLSGTFVLAGLIAYLKVRGPVDADWTRQLLALTLLAAFGALAALTKETGVLTAVYGLILELCVLTRTSANRRLSPVAIALMVGCALLFARLLPILFWAPSTEMERGFTMPERLASQGVLLLAYLKGLFLPTSSELNPFRSYNAHHDMLHTLWGVCLWIALMLSPLIAWWRGWRLPALALAWFFYGHIPESGWVPLELYFAHRNYLPAVGLVFALVFGLLSLRQHVGLWRSVFAAYVVVLGVVTWMNTSLWGQSELAAEVWANEQPHSARAAMNLAYELDRTQGLGAAQNHLDRFVQRQDRIGIRLIGLINACQLAPAADHSDRVREIKSAILTLPYEGWATDTLEKLIDPVRKGECPGLTEQQVGEIAATFLSQPVYQEQHSVASNMLSILGLVAMDHGDMEAAMSFYLQAIEHSATYSMANLYLHLAQQHRSYAELQRLHEAVVHAALPQGTSRAEWDQLLANIDFALKISTPEHAPKIAHPGAEIAK